MGTKRKEIKLSDEWSLVADPHCWIMRNYKKGTKQEVQTYHATVEQALNHYVNSVLKASDSAMGLLVAIVELKAEIVVFGKKFNTFVEGSGGRGKLMIISGD